MASRSTRDIPGKEKRGTSPSNIPTTARTTTNGGRSPNPLKKPVSTAHTHDASGSEKPIPNYLKSTLSSRPDPSKQQGKKPVSENEITQKPTLLRRRSFDKPPSTSQSQRSRVSPNPTLRSSSSFSGKTVSPQKGVPDKNFKTPKDAGKQHTLYARPNTARKNGIYVKKHEILKEKAVYRPKKVENVNIPEVPEPEMQQELAVAQDEEDIVQNGDNNEKVETDSCLKDQDPIRYEQIEGENLEPSIISNSVVEDEKKINKEQTEEVDILTSETFTVSEHQDDPVMIKESEGMSDNKDTNIVTTIEASDSPMDDQEPININQIDDDIENTDAKILNFEPPEESEQQTREIEIVEPLEVTEHQDVYTRVNIIEETKLEELKEDTINQIHNIINSDDSLAYNNRNDVDEKKQEEEIKEGEAREVIMEKKPVVPVVQMAHGKKEIAVSNDVIEETASKLREQRKNKVRALAGAFETVISLQEPK